jgi:hypothetical protein
LKQSVHQKDQQQQTEVEEEEEEEEEEDASSHHIKFERKLIFENLDLVYTSK